MTGPETGPDSETPYEVEVEVEVEREFIRVMCNDAAAKYGYDTARHFGLDETGCLKAAIVALSNARSKLFQARLKAAETRMKGT